MHILRNVSGSDQNGLIWLVGGHKQAAINYSYHLNVCKILCFLEICQEIPWNLLNVKNIIKEVPLKNRNLVLIDG